MELEQMPQPGPGLYGSDREVFERVWRRVMETGGGESPVEVIPEGAGLPAPFPEVSAPAAPLLLPPDPEDAIRCLGPASSRYGEALQQFIQAELQDAATYRALARRGRSGSRFAIPQQHIKNLYSIGPGAAVLFFSGLPKNRPVTAPGPINFYVTQYGYKPPRHQGYGTGSSEYLRRHRP